MDTSKALKVVEKVAAAGQWSTTVSKAAQTSFEAVCERLKLDPEKATWNDVLLGIDRLQDTVAIKTKPDRDLRQVVKAFVQALEDLSSPDEVQPAIHDFLLSLDALP
jgi:hypothetical protein